MEYGSWTNENAAYLGSNACQFDMTMITEMRIKINDSLVPTSRTHTLNECNRGSRLLKTANMFRTAKWSFGYDYKNAAIRRVTIIIVISICSHCYVWSMFRNKLLHAAWCCASSPDKHYLLSRVYVRIFPGASITSFQPRLLLLSS